MVVFSILIGIHLVVMRFKFRGGEDCPDWVLAEISTISRLSSIKLKLVCVQIMNHLEDEDMKYDVFMKLIDSKNLSVSDVKGIVAALTFILKSSLKYDVEPSFVDSELQQLGFPKEHSGALTKVFTDHLQRGRDALRRQSLRLPPPEVTWTVDYLKHSSKYGPLERAVVNLNINGTPCTVSVDQLDLLIHELKQASASVRNISL